MPVRETVSLGATFSPDGKAEGYLKNNFKINIRGGYDLDLPIVGPKDGNFTIKKGPNEDFSFLKVDLN